MSILPIIIADLLPETNLNILRNPVSLIAIKLVVTSIDITNIIYAMNILV